MYFYYCRIVRRAVSHSLDLTQTIIFVLVVLAGLAIVVVPTTQKLLGRLDVGGAIVAGSVLVLIILVRLLLAPYWIHKEEAAELATTRKTLSDISEERPLAFVNIQCNARGNDFHTTPTWNITRMEFVFQNLSDRLLTYKVQHVLVEYIGRKHSLPLPVTGTTYIHGGQQMTFGFDVGGIETKQFPFELTVGFDAHYDNVPPLKARGTRRKVRYTFQSFRPVIANSLILEQEEYDVTLA